MENSELKSFKFCQKIDLESHSACVEGLVNTYMSIHIMVENNCILLLVSGSYYTNIEKSISESSKVKDKPLDLRI